MRHDTDPMAAAQGAAQGTAQGTAQGAAAPPGGEAALLEVRDLWREFPSGDGVVAVLKGIDLSIRAGEMVAIMGASGSASPR